MGVFAVPLQVSNLHSQSLRHFEATVDTGASFTVLPANVLRELNIVPVFKDTFELGDGRSIEQDVGFAWVTVEGKTGVSPVVFAHNDISPLLGAVTLQILSLAVDPRGEQLVPRVNIWYEFASKSMAVASA